MNANYKSYCDHCARDIVICGKCGHNTCSGGYGEVSGPETGVMIQCDQCPSAYLDDMVAIAEELGLYN